MARLSRFILPVSQMMKIHYHPGFTDYQIYAVCERQGARHPGRMPVYFWRHSLWIAGRIALTRLTEQKD
ncbi:hypothetical protein ACLB1Q_07155 [Escherichia coli]